MTPLRDQAPAHVVEERPSDLRRQGARQPTVMEFVPLDEVARQYRDQPPAQVTGGKSRRRQATVRTVVERIEHIDEADGEVHHAPRSSEPIGSLVLRKMVAWGMACVAALFGTGCLFAIVNSDMAMFFACLVVGVGFLAGFLALNGYRHD